MIAVIITGDRNARFPQWAGTIVNALDEFDPAIVIHGDAPGIDTLAGREARSQGRTVIPMPALWEKHGNSAGPLRNMAMLGVLIRLSICGYDVAVLAFHDDLNGSKGTRNMVKIARQDDIAVTLYCSDGGKEQVA